MPQQQQSQQWWKKAKAFIYWAKFCDFLHRRLAECVRNIDIIVVVFLVFFAVLVLVLISVIIVCCCVSSILFGLLLWLITNFSVYFNKHQCAVQLCVKLPASKHMHICTHIHSLRHRPLCCYVSSWNGLGIHVSVCLCKLFLPFSSFIVRLKFHLLTYNIFTQCLHVQRKLLENIINIIKCNCKLT